MGIFGRAIEAIRSSLSSKYGSFRQSRAVGRLFESYEILPDFIYYYTGPDAEPTAILGVHNDYSLRSRFWKKVDLTQRQLKAWVDLMSDHIDFAPMPRGFFVLDDRGTEIGIFYSVNKTKVKIEKGDEIVVCIPDEVPVLDRGQ